jgi:hypothetical protein
LSGARDRDGGRTERAKKAQERREQQAAQVREEA